MKKRLQNLARIVELKDLQRRAGEWRRAALQRRETEILGEEELLVQALNADQPLHGLFVDAMARRLRLLSEQLDRTRRAEQGAAAEVAHHSRQLKVGERLLADASRLNERSAEAKQLAEMIDAALARDRTSLP